MLMSYEECCQRQGNSLMTSPHHYFDWAAAAPPFPEALRAQSDAAALWFGNPSATHQAGHTAQNEWRRLRDALAALCRFDGRFIATSGATESNNLVIHGVMRAAPDARVAVAEDVHASIWEACLRYRNRMDIVPVEPDGSLSSAILEKHLKRGTALFCCSHGSNETGVIHDAESLASVCRRLDVKCLMDGSQTLGHGPVDLSVVTCDFYSFASHKFGGPRGFGGLFTRCDPGEPLFNGGRQQWGLRAGTENLPGLAGTVEALRLSIEAMPSETIRLRALALLVLKALRDANLEFVMNGDPATGLPGFVSCSFPGLNGSALAADLGLRGFDVATGSACHADVIEPSRVIMALDKDIRRATGAIRISFGRLTTSESVEAFAAALVDTVAAHAGIKVPIRLPPASGTVKTACCCSDSPCCPKPANPVPESRSGEPDFSALDRASDPIRRRMVSLIERSDPYFMLTGSDPADADGCCPSDEVGEANLLVAAGILCRHIPTAHPDACTTALYALAGEIGVDVDTESPVFTPNEALRTAVLKRLGHRPFLAKSPVKTTLRLAILLLFVLGVAAAIRQAWPSRDSRSLKDLVAATLPTPREGSGVMVVYFMGSERCERCSVMDRLSRQVVNETFASESGRVAFVAIDLAKPENTALRQRMAQPFSTLGVARFENGRAEPVHMITGEAWGLYQDEAAFRDMLAAKIRTLLPRGGQAP